MAQPRDVSAVPVDLNEVPCRGTTVRDDTWDRTVTIPRELGVASEAPARLTSIGSRELAIMLASSMAMTALAIDIMLPAFADIREALGLAADSSAVGQLVTAFFLGLAVAQIPAGVLADRFGRKPVLRIGLLLYAAGAVGTLLAPSLGWMLMARFVWGLGAGGPRVVAIAIVRDRYSGDQMAQVMSMVMAMFLVVPVVAPSLGALLLLIGPWQLVFGFCAVAATAVNVWAGRLPETLAAEHRRPLGLRPTVDGARAVLRSRQTVLLGIALTALMAAMTSFLAGIELIIDETFGLVDAFPFIFGALASAMGIASLVNGRFVEHVGMWNVLRVTTVSYVTIAAIVLGVAIAADGEPAPWLYLPLLSLLLANQSLVLPNLNSAAMQPVGAVAGTASAMLGAASIAVGALIGAAVAQTFDGTVRPLATAFLVSGVVALVCFVAARRHHDAHVAHGSIGPSAQSGGRSTSWSKAIDRSAGSAS